MLFVVVNFFEISDVFKRGNISFVFEEFLKKFVFLNEGNSRHFFDSDPPALCIKGTQIFINFHCIGCVLFVNNRSILLTDLMLKVLLKHLRYFW